MKHYLILSVGLFAQILFSLRLLIQWIASERAHKVLSPILFWQISLFASLLLCFYGWLRNDFAIIIGQLLSYYIYIWNLNLKGSWNKLSNIVQIIFLFLPAAMLIGLTLNVNEVYTRLFKQNDLPLWLIAFGVTGQFTFTLRFIYQWIYSRKIAESTLPIIFWIISLIGSTMIITYAIIRHDIVLMIGQSTGLFVYIRNIIIYYKYNTN